MPVPKLWPDTGRGGRFRRCDPLRLGQADVEPRAGRLLGVATQPCSEEQEQVRALRCYLERVDLDLCRRTKLWSEPLLVFAHPDSMVDAKLSPIPVFSPGGVVEVTRTAAPRQWLAPTDYERIVELLVRAQRGAQVDCRAGVSPSARGVARYS